MSVLLAGELAARDPGDAALVTAFARELPRWPLALISPDPTSASERHGVPALSPRDPRRMLSALRQCELLVLGNGALHGSGRGERKFDMLATALAAKALGRRVALIGVGAGALRGSADRARVGALVRLSDLLVLRDRCAAQRLVAAGAPGPFRVAADPAWATPARPASSRDRREGVLVILDAQSMRSHGPRVAALAGALDILAVAGLRIRLAPWRIGRSGIDDLDLAHAIARRLGAQARILLPPSNFEEAQVEAAHARVVLALRVHGLIVAAQSRTPAVALDHGGDVAALAARLGQPALPMTAAPAAIADTVRCAAQGPPAEARRIRAEKDTVDDTFRLLRLLIDAARSDEDHDLAALPLVPTPRLTSEPVIPG
ncbi:MAG: polysaccharide pyruvyl transferase family protein [Solirubrobacteraceae bacterium]